MPWVGAVVGAAASLYSGAQASKAQGEMLDRQERMQGDDLAFRRGLYLDEKEFIDPIRMELRDQALQDGPLDFGPMRDEINLQYDNMGRSLEAQLSRSGLTGSGMDAGATRGLMLRKASDLTKAFQQGLINKRQLALALLSNDKKMQAAAMLGQGYQNSANTLGNFAAMYGQGAQAGYGAAASALQGLTYLMNTNQGSGGGQSPQATTSAAFVPEYGPQTSTIPSDVKYGYASGLVPQPVPQPVNWGASTPSNTKW